MPDTPEFKFSLKVDVKAKSGWIARYLLVLMALVLVLLVTLTPVALRIFHG